MRYISYILGKTAVVRPVFTGGHCFVLGSSLRKLPLDIEL